jgi:CheY-like chemotaxis protein
MSHPATVLIADDDEGISTLLRYAFEEAQLSANIVHAAEGQQVIDYLSSTHPYEDKEQYPMPDLLLLDLRMPKKDGFDVLAWLQTRPELNRLPVVVLSTSAMEFDREQAFELGANDYQVKPLRFEMLLRFVRSLDARWLNPG